MKHQPNNSAVDKIKKHIKIVRAWVKTCLLKSTTNPAHFGWKLAGLAVLFSISQDFLPL